MKILLLLSLSAACALAETRAEQPPAAAPATEPGLYAIINTSMGPITAKLFEKEAPQTVNSFVGLATGTRSWQDPNTGAVIERPVYQNLRFTRVIPGYVIQTGDPTNTGTYDCGIRVKDEIAPTLRFDQPGRLGLMNLGEPDSGGCQFFITDDAYPALDPAPRSHGYAVFGQVVKGQEVVDQISNVPSDASGRPRTVVRLVSVALQRVGPGAAPPAPKAAPAARRAAPPAARRVLSSKKMPDFN